MKEVKEPSARYSPHGGGYILLWKKALSSAVFQDANLWKAFTWCLLRANFSRTPLLMNMKEMQLERGQFVTGRFQAAKELNMNNSLTYRSIKSLESLGLITVKSNNKFSIITVCNYASYQDFNFKSEQPMNNQRTTSEQPVNTDKEEKEYKEVKEKSIAKPDTVLDTIDYGREINLEQQECEAFFDHFESNGWKVGGKSPMKSWKAALRNWKRNAVKFGNKPNTTQSKPTPRYQSVEDMPDYQKHIQKEK